MLFPDKRDFQIIVRELWDLPEREFQALHLILCTNYKKAYKRNTYPLLRRIDCKKNLWWDTVDSIATYIFR
ncbi:hypothetical protein CW304_25550 [Bacillus sp. UFRGS-B20]|nr:hypothetical protein CW304_25550 [Bacillus sp. UFRGS-B20]